MEKNTTTTTTTTTTPEVKIFKAQIRKFTYKGKPLVGRVLSVNKEKGVFSFKCHAEIFGNAQIANLLDIQHAEIMAYLGK